MSTTKIAISLDSDLLKIIDEFVKERLYPNRSKAIQEAIREKVERLNKSRLAIECAKLDPDYERAMADEGIAAEMDEWPEFIGRKQYPGMEYEFASAFQSEEPEYPPQ